MTERRTKPFIAVDCGLDRNERVLDCDDPGGCLGVWLVLTSYIRESELETARVPKKFAAGAFSGDQRNAARLAELVRVGLLADGASHYEVLRYEPRNQLKKTIEKNRKANRLRMQSVRTHNERTTNAVQAKCENSAGVVPTSTSLSTFRSSSGDARGATTTALAPDFELTAERRAFAEMIPLRDVDGVFRKFRDTCAETGKMSADWDATWRKFCAREVGFQRADRARASRPGEPLPEVTGPRSRPVEAYAPPSAEELDRAIAAHRAAEAGGDL